MSSRHGNAQSGELLPGIIIPPEIHGLLRRRLAQVESADSAVDCLIAQARAESLVEALEVIKAIPAQAIERLYVVVEHSTQARLSEIGGQVKA